MSFKGSSARLCCEVLQLSEVHIHSNGAGLGMHILISERCKICSQFQRVNLAMLDFQLFFSPLKHFVIFFCSFTRLIH